MRLPSGAEASDLRVFNQTPFHVVVLENGTIARLTRDANFYIGALFIWLGDTETSFCFIKGFSKVSLHI